MTGVENVGYLYGKKFGMKNSLSHLGMAQAIFEDEPFPV
jgi:hypothetical protein